MNMGQKINELRLAKGMTLEELGNKVGVGKSTVRKWETGMIENMRRDKIVKIADALGCTVAYLLGLEENGHKTAYSSFIDTDGHIISVKDETLDVFSNQVQENIDPDIRRIQRAREKMSEQEKTKMMKILEASFDDYFGDDFIDEDND